VYNKNLATILKSGMVLESYELLCELGIDHGEAALVKAVSRPLVELEGWGPIRPYRVAGSGFGLLNAVTSSAVSI